MANEVDLTEAWSFLALLEAEMQKGRKAEEFFRIITNEDRLRKHLLGYGTALDGAVFQNIRRGVVNAIAKPWLQDSNCCTPYFSPFTFPQSDLQCSRSPSHPFIRDWQRNHMPRMRNEQWLQYLDNEHPVEIDMDGYQGDVLGLVALFKDEAAVVERLQQVEYRTAPITVGLIINPQNPLDSSRTQTFRAVIGDIFWKLIWEPRFAKQTISPQKHLEIQNQLHQDCQQIFFPMFDADQSKSIDVMELVLGLIRLFRAFHSYDNHVADPILAIKRRCLSPLFNNLCKEVCQLQGQEQNQLVFSFMLTRMHQWDTLKAFLQSLFNENLWHSMHHYQLFSPLLEHQLELCCSAYDPSQRSQYDAHCASTIDLLSRELFAQLRPFCDASMNSQLAFFVHEQYMQSFFEVKSDAIEPSPNGYRSVLFLFLWKLMDHFLSKTTSLCHFFSDHHVVQVDDLKSIRIEDLISELDRTKAETHVIHSAVQLKRWFLYHVGCQFFGEACSFNPDMANYYLRKFNGAAIDQFASLLFHVDDAQQMADFRDDQKQAEIEFFAQQLYDSEVPTFGRTTGLSSIGFSFNLQHFVGFMTNYFQDGQRDLHSPLFKRTCEVWFNCFGANKSIPSDSHNNPAHTVFMHLNFKRMLWGLNKARQYLLTNSAEHSFALAFELVDLDGNQVLDRVEIQRWFYSWIIYDFFSVGEDPGAVLEFYFKSGMFVNDFDSLPVDFREYLGRFQSEGRFFSYAEPNFKQFIEHFKPDLIKLLQSMAERIATELLNITTAYQFELSRLNEQTISRQDMSCLLLDPPHTNRFVVRLTTTDIGHRNLGRVIRTDGFEQKGFGFLLSLQNLFKRWLSLHGMWHHIPASNAETAQVQADFHAEKALVVASLSSAGLPPGLVAQLSNMFDEIRNHVANLPNSSCDAANFRSVMSHMMSIQLCPPMLVSKVDSLFLCFDVDGNGSLDAIEIMNGFRTLHSRNQSALADLAFRLADSSTDNRGPFSGSKNQRLDEDEFKKLIKTICTDEPYVLQVILRKICMSEPPYFVSCVTQFSPQDIEHLRCYSPFALVRDFSNPIPGLHQHQALAVALLDDPAVGHVLLKAICNAVRLLRSRNSPHIDQHDFKQMFENNQLFGWMLRFWLLRGFLTEEHPQYSRLSGYSNPNEISFSDNIEASEAKARRPDQHLAWYFLACGTNVDELLSHLQQKYIETTGSAFGQFNQRQFENVITDIFRSLGIKDTIDMLTLFEMFDDDKSGEISRKEIIDGFLEHFHKIRSVFEKIVAYFCQKMNQDQNMTLFCAKHNISVQQFVEKLKSLFLSRCASLDFEIDEPGFCALWKQMLISLGIRQPGDPNIDNEASHMFHCADASRNEKIDFAELLYFVSTQCVTLLQKSADEHQKIEDLLRRAARHQEKHGPLQVLGDHSAEAFLNYAWKCFQVLAAAQHRDPVHFECSKNEFTQLWNELKSELGFGDEEPSMHIDQVYPHIDKDGSGTISALEMIEGLIRHFLPRAELSRSQSKAPGGGLGGGGGGVVVSGSRPRGSTLSSSASRPRPSITPGSPLSLRVNPADAQLMSRVRDEPWFKQAEDAFDSIEEDSIEAEDFNAVVTRLFEKKKTPVPSTQTLQSMFKTFDTNGDDRLTKTELVCGLWRILAFADAASAASDDHEEEDEETGGEWEGEYMQYLRLAIVPFAQRQMLNVSRLHGMLSEILLLQVTQDILDGLAELDYEIDGEHAHLMREIPQPGKPTLDLNAMQEKISTCSFGLAFEMMFKGLGSSTELDFAHVCSVECPVSAVMAKFFEADPKGTYGVRQVMRHYLSSDDMFCAGDRSYFLRLKNARSASRVGASVGRPSVSRTVVPSSPPIAPNPSPLSEAPRDTKSHAIKRPNQSNLPPSKASTVDISQQRFTVNSRQQAEADEDDDDEDDDDDDDGNDDDGNDDDGAVDEQEEEAEGQGDDGEEDDDDDD